MRLSSLDNFKQEVRQVLEYIAHIEYANTLMSINIPKKSNKRSTIALSNFKAHYQIFQTDKRVFEYKAVIITLYGILEKYMEIWTKEYLEFLTLIVRPYNLLEEKIKESHFELSIRLINIIATQNRAKYQNLTKENILKKLYYCIENNSTYQFNYEAFTVLSGGNLKHQRIVDLFKALNIDINKHIKKNVSISEFVKNDLQIESTTTVNVEKLCERIDKLVDRRNEIAHGSEVIDNILGVSEIQPYIVFLGVYGSAVFDSLIQEIINYECRYNFQKIENVTNVWARECVLGFSITNCKIKVGDILLVKDNGYFLKRYIKEIRVNNRSVKTRNIRNESSVTIKADTPIKRSQTFYLKNN